MAQPTPLQTADQWTERLHAWAVEHWERCERRLFGRKSRRRQSIWPLWRNTHSRWNRFGLFLCRGMSSEPPSMGRSPKQSIRATSYKSTWAAHMARQNLF